MTDRVRRSKRLLTNRLRVSTRVEFRNPYPHMSAPEAMVHLELEQREVPFSWRFFDGESPHRSTLLPEFHPEFTLREYKVVIIVLGGFFGSLPGVLDDTALAMALLEADGWTVKAWTEEQIRKGVSDLMDRDLPALKNPAIKGKPRPNPYGIPDFMERRRQQLRAQGLRRRRFALDNQQGATRDPRRRRPRRASRRRRLRR